MSENGTVEREFVLRSAEENDVKFVRLWFTDILGNLKGFAITVDDLEDSMEQGVGFDGSSIEGFARIDESDMRGFPDPITFTLLPWRPRQNAVARSIVAKRFIAGLLRHAPEITLVTNQWVNSYKRLVPGFEAPVYVSWAHVNRSDLVRVPAYKPGYESSVRIEYRAPDPACNPYLAFSAMLAAGLRGIEEEYPVPPPVEGNVFAMAPEERQSRGHQDPAR